MKILVMDHNSIEPEKQRIWADLMRRFEIGVTIVTPETWPNSYGDAALRAERLTTFEGDYLPTPVLMSRSIPMHIYATDLRRIVRAVAPDAIYAYHDYYMFAAFQMFLANRATLRVPIGFYASQNISKDLPFPLSRSEKYLLANSDFLFPISDEATHIAVAKGFRGESVAMPLYVDTGLFAPPDGDPLRGRIGLPPDAFLVGFAGRLVERKGLRGLLEAVARLGDPSVHVVLTGKGEMEAELPGIAASLGIGGKLHLLPPVSQRELAPVLGGCDVVAMPSLTVPSWKEQFGRLLIEALACGTPVIGSSSGAIPEVIAATGGGLVVPEGDTAALAAAIGAMKQDPRRRAELARVGRARTLETYSLDAFVGRMGEYFLSLADRRAAA